MTDVAPHPRHASAPQADRASGAGHNSDPRTDGSARLGLISTLLHRVGNLTARSATGLVVAVAVIIFLAALLRAGAPEEWQIGFATVASATTLVMVFVLQHTQSRQQLATQLKLDELIRTSPRADDLLVHVESADDDELRSIERDQLDHHSSVREGNASDGAANSPR